MHFVYPVQIVQWVEGNVAGDGLNKEDNRRMMQVGCGRILAIPAGTPAACLIDGSDGNERLQQLGG